MFCCCQRSFISGCFLLSCVRFFFFACLLIHALVLPGILYRSAPSLVKTVCTRLKSQLNAPCLWKRFFFYVTRKSILFPCWTLIFLGQFEFSFSLFTLSAGQNPIWLPHLTRFSWSWVLIDDAVCTFFFFFFKEMVLWIWLTRVIPKNITRHLISIFVRFVVSDRGMESRSMY